MDRTGESAAADRRHETPLHKLRRLRRAPFYRAFAAVYACGLVALLYHHTQTLLLRRTSLVISISLLFSDFVLAFMWLGGQSFRMLPVRRLEYPENLGRVVSRSESPGLDVFVCTADPYKEPPMSVVNTALSVMGYDYPTEKVSVYVSDDGWSELTLFAFMEAAEFAGHWLPFCRDNNIVERSPQAYFTSQQPWCPKFENIKMMYQGMKVKVEDAVNTGRISDGFIIQQRHRQAFKTWTDHGSSSFTRLDHPTVIQVLLESATDTDISGHPMPNLIYVSREKNKTSPHNFKAGALNALLRVSATMTNAPIVLTLDCDTYSNDPQTLSRALCYISDPTLRPKLSYVQFPQRSRDLNDGDIYNSELIYPFRVNPMGMDGLSGPDYFGSGTFFCRRCFFGPPSLLLLPDTPELSPLHVVDMPICSRPVLAMAHGVASCDFENNTTWGTKVGFRYGSLVEDFFTGYQLHCEGWKSIFCDPERPAFYGDIPINLNDVLNQIKRWVLGGLEVAFSRYSPLTFGVRALGPLMALSYGFYAFWSLWSIPVLIYAFLPQLTLLNGVPIFPKVSEPWFMLYMFLFLGAYTQNYLDFALAGGTLKRWWSDQRMWMARGISTCLFGSVEFLLKSLAISTVGFNVTSKVVDNEQSKRYKQGIFEFGVHSPMFVPLVMASTVNLFSFLWGLKLVFAGQRLDLLLQLLISGFVVLNCLPVYEAMVVRTDKGKMPIRTTMVSIVLVLGVCKATVLVLGN